MPHHHNRTGNDVGLNGILNHAVYLGKIGWNALAPA
jgi:hypothetical protein